jgi:hypothetical protein
MDLDKWQDAPRVVGRRPDPQIQIFGRAWQAMRRHRVAADDEEVNALVDERGQDVAEVGIQHCGLR